MKEIRNTNKWSNMNFFFPKEVKLVRCGYDTMNSIIPKTITLYDIKTEQEYKYYLIK
jgi:hypothetical protein